MLDNAEAMQQPLATDLDEEPAPSETGEHQTSTFGTILRQDEDSESDNEGVGQSTALQAEVNLEIATFKNLRKNP